MEIDHVVCVRIQSSEIEHGNLILQIALADGVDGLLVALGVSCSLVRVALSDELEGQRAGKRSELVPQKVEQSLLEVRVVSFDPGRFL